MRMIDRLLNSSVELKIIEGEKLIKIEWEEGKQESERVAEISQDVYDRIIKRREMQQVREAT